MNKYYKLLLSLLILDLITKILANLLLPFQKIVRHSDLGIYFYLTYNKGVAGTLTNTLYGKNNLFYLQSSLLAVFLGIYILSIHNSSWTRRNKIISTILFFFLLIFVLPIIIEKINLNPSNYLTSLLNRLGASILVYSYFKISKREFYKYSWIIILSAGCGNLLNHFYSPYKIIDFIQIDILTELFGFGVMNFADLFWKIGIVLLLFSVVYYNVYLKLFKRQKT